MFISNDIAIKLNYFRTTDGIKAIEVLSQILMEEYQRQCTLTEGNELYRCQGKAQLALWLKDLPKGLANAANVAIN